MFRCVIEQIDNYIEDCKEKEYVVYHKVNMINGRYNRYLFTKKQLLRFMKEHETCDIEVFKIKDNVKINKIFEVED